MTKVCTTCGKSFDVPHPPIYVYKMKEHTTKGRMLYFCSYGCKSSYEKSKEHKEKA